MPDGTRVPLAAVAAHEVPALADRAARSALAVADATGDPAVLGITGAGVAAVTADDMEPYEEVRARFETWRENPYQGNMSAGAWPGPVTWELAPGVEELEGVVVLPGADETSRDYPLEHAFVLDVDELDGVADLYDEDHWSGGMTVTYWPETPLERLARNAEALPAGEAWAVTGGGTYSRPVDATSPVNPLDEAATRYVHAVTGAVTGTVLSSPVASPCCYALAGGRAFTVVAWMKASAVVRATARVVAESTDGTVTLRVLEGPSRVVGTSWERHVFTVVEATSPGTWSIPGQHRRYLELEVTDGSGDLSVRLPHVYAGAEDRGDLAGLGAVPLPLPFGKRMAVTSTGRPRLINRMDVTGDGAHGAVTAFTLAVGTPDDNLLVGVYGGPGDGCARIPEPVALLPADDDGAGWTSGGWAGVSLEEVDTGPGGWVWVHKLEPSHEVDLTPDVVRVTVGRTADADPTDATNPLGNYAAAQLQVDLDNTDAKWSPFRVDYLSVAHQLEAAVGTVYTNRHGNPSALTGVGEWLEGAWDAGALEVAPTLAGIAPATGRGGMSEDAPVWACMPVMPGSRWEVEALIAADGFATVALVEGDGVTVLVAATPMTPGMWVPYRVVVDVPDTAAAGASLRVGVATPTGTAWVSDPSFTRLDPDNGDAVVEVAEAAPAGVFYVTVWPQDTASPTLSVDAVDALSLYGDGETAAELLRDVYLSDVLVQVARYAFDIPTDRTVVPDSAGPMPWVLPPSTELSTFVADLAKAEARTLYLDGLGRLVAQNRQYVETDTTGEYRQDNAAISLATPLSLDTVRNRVNVIGSVVREEASRSDVAYLGEQEPPNPATWTVDMQAREWLLVPSGKVATYTLFYEDAAAVADAALEEGYAYSRGQVLPTVGSRPLVNRLEPLDPETENVVGGFLGWELTTYPTFATLRLKAGGAGASTFDMFVPYLRFTGLRIQEGEVVETVTRPASAAQYGNRPVDVTVRLVTDSGFLEAVGKDVLDTWSLVAEDGSKWLPDLQVAALGDPWRELGDRVLAAEPVSGIGGDYRVVSHVYDGGAGAASDLYLRQVPSGLQFMFLDVDTLDGPGVLGY